MKSIKEFSNSVNKEREKKKEKRERLIEGKKEKEGVIIKNKEEIKKCATNEEERRIIAELITIAEKTLEFAQPENLMEEKIKFENQTMKIKGRTIELERYRKHYLVAIGKAAQKMAKWMIKRYPKEWEEIVIVYPKGSKRLKEIAEEEREGRVKVFEGGHPIPNDESEKAAEYLIQLFKNIKKEDIGIILLSGGGSALVEKPDYKIKLDEYKRLMEKMITSGADIQEINIVRKHLSKIKGGKLRRYAKGKIVTIAISDVIPNDPTTIASGPTIKDQEKSTWKEVDRIFKKYKLYKTIPKNIREIVEKGKKGEIDETPKVENGETEYYIIGDNKEVRYKIAEEIAKRSTAIVIGRDMTGEAKIEAKKIIKKIEKIERTIKGEDDIYIIGGGETTVKITKNKGKGKGGRNQEVALKFAIENKEKNRYIITLATDGMDGNSEAAGAIVGPWTVGEEKRKIKEAKRELKRHNTNEYLRKYGGEIKTGYTGTNVADITIIKSCAKNKEKDKNQNKEEKEKKHKIFNHKKREENEKRKQEKEKRMGIEKGR